jgi:hypothetical protein
MADTTLEWAKLRRSKPIQRHRARGESQASSYVLACHHVCTVASAVKAAVLVLVAAVVLAGCAAFEMFSSQSGNDHLRRSLQSGKKPLPPVANRSTQEVGYARMLAWSGLLSTGNGVV